MSGQISEYLCNLTSSLHQEESGGGPEDTVEGKHGLKCAFQQEDRGENQRSCVTLLAKLSAIRERLSKKSAPLQRPFMGRLQHTSTHAWEGWKTIGKYL
jgi:hypothetical protein